MKTESHSQEIIYFQTNYKQATWQVHYKPFCTLDLLNSFNSYCENCMRKRKKKKKSQRILLLIWQKSDSVLEIDLDLGVLASSKGASIYFFMGVRDDFFSSAKEIKDKNMSWFLCNEKCFQKKNGIEVTGHWEFWTCYLSGRQHCKDLWKVMAFSFSFICYFWVAYNILIVF